MTTGSGNDALAGRFAASILDAAAAPLPDAVVIESIRTFVNVLGTAVGASGSEPVDAIIAVGAEGASSVPGRRERVDQVSAATAIATAAHLEDFDDTHLATVVHPGASVLGSVYPLAEALDTPGEVIVKAIALGVEAQLRVALAMNPQHYDAGWHVTGTVGPIGAAVAASIVLGAGSAELAHACGIATSLTVGHREGFGTMVKSLHAGKAAANGLLAATLAVRGFTAKATALEGPRGYFNILAQQWEEDALLDGFGEHWEILRNTYKPYPCGIVIHPLIDAALELVPGLDHREIVQVSVRCHPLVAELTGDLEPSDGLQTKFSAVHAVAAALVTGSAGPGQFSTKAARDPAIRRVRRLTALSVTETIAREAGAVEVRFEDGTTRTASVEVARGSVARPLTDAELYDKAHALIATRYPHTADDIIGAARALGAGAAFVELVQHLTDGDLR